MLRWATLRSAAPRIQLYGVPVEPLDSSIVTPLNRIRPSTQRLASGWRSMYERLSVSGIASRIPAGGNLSGSTPAVRGGARGVKLEYGPLGGPRAPRGAPGRRQPVRVDPGGPEVVAVGRHALDRPPGR